MKRFLLLILVFCVYLSKAQYFTDSLFKQQVQQYFKTIYSLSKQSQNEFNSFLLLWDNDLASYHDLIIETLNTLYDKSFDKYKLWNYLLITNRLVGSGKMQFFVDWSKQLGILAENQPNKVPVYIGSLKTVVVDSTLTYNEQLQIKVIDGQFDFDFDKYHNVIVIFNSPVDLLITYKGDTVLIHSTQGRYFCGQRYWQGSGGKIPWRKFRSDTTESYVLLSQYKILPAARDQMIDNVRMTLNTGFIKISNLRGKLRLRFSADKKVQQKSPIFYGYDKLGVKNLVPQGDFKGLVTVKGEFIDLDGELNFHYKGRNVIQAKARDFQVHQRFMRATNVQMYVTVKDRLIFHPHVNMLLLLDTAMIYKLYPFLSAEIFQLSPPRVLSFYREVDGLASQPFFDLYHDLVVYTTELVWTFRKNIYFVQSLHTEYKEPYLASINYYGQEQLQDLIDPMGVNYAGLLYQYLRKKGFPDTVYVSNFFNFISRRGVRTTQKYLYYQLEKMAWKGWMEIKFNQNYSNSYVYNIRPIFKHIIRASLRSNLIRRNKLDQLDKYSEDYDIIKIRAVPVYDSLKFLRKLNYYTLHSSGIVAQMDLNTANLRVLRPKPFYLSKAQKVIVKADTLIFKKGMNFTFSGKLQAGLTLSEGENFDFNYKKFNLNLNKVKALKLFYLKPIDSIPVAYNVTDSGDTNFIYQYRYKLDSVASQINNFKAVVQIDSPANKSGLLAKASDKYPIYRTLTNSKIYYPNAPVDTAHFFFLNYPFTLTSTDHLTAGDLKMLGKFRSSILADIDSLTLTLQDDKSLGFVKFDTTEGFTILGAAKLLGYLKLDNKGLHSTGDLKFLSTSFKGDFELRPDTLLGVVDSMFMSPVDDKRMKTEHFPARYPLITFSGKADLKLFRETDSTQRLVLNQVSKQGFNIYPNFLKAQQRGQLDSGQLEITYQGVFARGRMDFIDAQLFSDKFYLDYDNFYSDTCRFVYKDSTFKESLFNTNNVSCQMDVVSKVGTFVSNDINNFITFPKNRYIVYSDHFMWQISKGLIDIGGDLPDPRFIVVADTAQRDSLIQLGKLNPRFIRLSGTRLVSMKRRNKLNFVAGRTVFVPGVNTLVAYDVPELKVADAHIIPSAPVVIYVGGILDTLRHARIILEPYKHKIKQATAYVKDSKFYSASGLYVFRDTQDIYFQKIEPVDTVSVGTAHLDIGQKLYLDKYFYYTGAASYDFIKLRGDRPFLEFKGDVGILSQCDTLRPRSVKVDQLINPDTVMIKVGYPIQGAYRTLTASPVIHKRSTYDYKLVNTFLTPPPNFQQDRILSKVSGYLSYQPVKAYYIIGQKEKIFNPDTSLPMVAFDYKRCFLFSDNQFDLGIDYGPDLKYKLAGKYVADLNSGRYQLRNIILKLDFPYVNGVFAQLIKALNNSENVEYVDFESDKDLSSSVLLWSKTGQEKQKFLESGVLPNSLSGTVVLGNLNLQWDPNRSSFRTIKGENTISVLYLNGKEIDVKVTGYVELRYERRHLSRIYIYLDFGGGNYYFFRYLYDGSKGFMNVLSSDGKAEKIISQLDRKHRQLTKHFEVGTAERDELSRFLRLYKQNF